MDSIEFTVGSPKSPIVIGLREYKGRKLLDIRKFYRSKSAPNELKPTKKGISLTGQQFSLVIDALIQHSSDIEEYYKPSTDLTVNPTLNVSFGHTMGRLFNINFENGTTNILLDDSLKKKLGGEQTQFLINLLLIFHKSLLDALEDDEDIELVLDALNFRLGGSIC